MSACLLTDIPITSFQVILQHLESEDHAKLRHVSSLLSKGTTQHLPFITLKLSDSSSTDQLQQWSQATRQLQHVKCIHIKVAGKVSTATFDTALHLLSERSVTELHLLAGGMDSRTAAAAADQPSSAQFRGQITSLQPLQQTLPQLQSLVIDGLAISSGEDLLQLITAAAASGHCSKLQKFVVNLKSTASSSVHWTSFATLMRILPDAFPGLNLLEFSIPTLLQYMPPTNEPLQLDVGEVLYPHSRSAAYRWQEQLAQVATVAAAANAAAKLTALQVLRLDFVPDIWHRSGSPVIPFLCDDIEAGIRSHSAVTTAARASAKAAAGVDIHLAGLPLPTVSAAATAFATMEGFGRWILEHNNQLDELSIRTFQTGWGMSWKQQQQSGNSSKLSGQPSTAAHRYVSINRASYYSAHQKLPVRRATGPSSSVFLFSTNSSSSSSSSGDDDDDDFNPRSLYSCFLSKLPCYITGSAPSMLCNINSFQLVMKYADLKNLPDLVCNMKALKHLAVILICKWSLVDDFEAAAEVIRTAATVQGLQALAVCVQDAVQGLSSRTLLPLTAAAGGPGSSLKKLRLSGRFARVAPAAGLNSNLSTAVVLKDMRQLHLKDQLEEFTAKPADQAHPACSGSVTPATAAAAAASPHSEWYHPLQQLHGLDELVLQQAESYLGAGIDLLDLQCECLPAGLKVFHGSNLWIHSKPAAADATACTSSSKHDSIESQAAPSTCLQLQTLRLVKCKISIDCFSTLASNQLQQLTIFDISWLGDWRAAVSAAWPNVRELVWTPPVLMPFGPGVSFSRQSPGTPGNTTTDSTVNLAFQARPLTLQDHLRDRRLAAHEAIEDLRSFLTGCKRLTSLTVCRVPWLFDVTLLPLQYLQQIQWLKICTEVAVGNHGLVGHGHGDISKTVRQWFHQQLPWAVVQLSNGAE